MNSSSPLSPILISASRYTLAPGDNLRLTGRFLKDATLVEIGGVSLPIIHNTASEIIVTVPTNPPLGQAKVTTPGGTGTLGRAFRPEPPPAPPTPPGGGASPASPTQQGADAAAAYDNAYNAARSAAEAAYQNAGGDSGGVAAHVAAQTAADAAAQAAAGPGQSAAGRRAASAAYTDFKTNLLTTGNGPNPGINPEGGASGADSPFSSESPGLQQLIATMQQWLQILPEPLRILATASQGILQAALHTKAQFPSSQGVFGGVWSTFNSSMNAASQRAFSEAIGGSPYGPYPVSPFQRRMQGVASWVGNGIGEFAGSLGLTDAAGIVPPAVAGAISAGIGALIIGSINNIKGSYEAGRQMSLAFTDGIRAGFSAIDVAARDLLGRITQMMGQPFGRSGAGVAQIFGAATSGLTGFVNNMVGFGAEMRATMNGLKGMWITGAVAVVGAGIGTYFAGPIGTAVGAFLGSLVGLLGTKLGAFFSKALGDFTTFVGKAVGEVLRMGGEAMQAFVQVMGDATEAAMEWAHTARGIANRTGFSDATSANYAWGLQGLGLSANDVRGMFGSAANGQFNRALTGAAWGLPGMPVQGDFNSYDYLSGIYQQAQALRKNMGPLGAQFQQNFLNSTGNGAMLDAVNLSPTAFYERLSFARQFDPADNVVDGNGRQGGAKVQAFEDGFGTLMSQWGTFVSWLRGSFGTELLPTLRTMFSSLVGYVKGHKGEIIDGIKNVAGWLYREGPYLVLNGLALLASGIGNIAKVIGAVLTGMGNGLPAILKFIESMLKSFRNTAAMAAGVGAVMADVSQHGWGPAGLRAAGTYRTGQQAFLRATPVPNLGMTPQQMANAQRLMRQSGSQLSGWGSGILGQGPGGGMLNNLVPNLTAKALQYDPAGRDLYAGNNQVAQIVQNTATTAQNTANIPNATGNVVGSHLREAMLEIIGVALRNSRRDDYYAARRA